MVSACHSERQRRISRRYAKPSMKMGGQEVAFSSIRELAGSHQLQFVINTYLA
jgi:hypothetical protein